MKMKKQLQYLKNKIKKYKKLKKKISIDIDKGKSIEVTLTHNDIVELRKLIDDQVEVLESVKSLIDEALEIRSKTNGKND